MVENYVKNDASEDFVIEMRHITKEFPGIIANDDITLQLRRGEIHALLGETAPENPRLCRCCSAYISPKKAKF